EHPDPAHVRVVAPQWWAGGLADDAAHAEAVHTEQVGLQRHDVAVPGGDREDGFGSEVLAEVQGQAHGAQLGSGAAAARDREEIDTPAAQAGDVGGDLVQSRADRRPDLDGPDESTRDQLLLQPAAFAW